MIFCVADVLSTSMLWTAKGRPVLTVLRPAGLYLDSWLTIQTSLLPMGFCGCGRCADFLGASLLVLTILRPGAGWNISRPVKHVGLIRESGVTSHTEIFVTW